MGSRSPWPGKFCLSGPHTLNSALSPLPTARSPCQLFCTLGDICSLPFPGGSYRWRQRLTMYSKKGREQGRFRHRGGSSWRRCSGAGRRTKPLCERGPHPWRRICNTRDPMASPLLRAPSPGDLMGAAPGPCPRLAPGGPRGPASRSRHGLPTGRDPRGEGASRGRGWPGSQRCETQARGAASGGGVPPHPRPRTGFRGPGREAGTGRAPVGGHPKVGVGWCSGGAATAPSVPPGKAPDPEVHFRSQVTASLGSALALLCGSRPGEAGEGAASRQPAGACAQRAKLGPGKGNLAA